jgi:hypothetical protein
VGKRIQQQRIVAARALPTRKVYHGSVVSFVGCIKQSPGFPWWFCFRYSKISITRSTREFANHRGTVRSADRRTISLVGVWIWIYRALASSPWSGPSVYLSLKCVPSAVLGRVWLLAIFSCSSGFKNTLFGCLGTFCSYLARILK